MPDGPFARQARELCGDRHQDGPTPCPTCVGLEKRLTPVTETLSPFLADAGVETSARSWLSGDEQDSTDWPALLAKPGALWVLPDDSGLYGIIAELTEAYAEWAIEYLNALLGAGDYDAATTAWNNVIQILARHFPHPIHLAALTGANTELDYYGDDHA